MPNPITGAPGLGDMPRTFANVKVQAADLDTGIVTPRALGLIARNQSGSTIGAGSLVYISGWSASLTGFANGLGLLSLAVATGRYTGATYITQAAIPNNSNGLLSQQMLMTGLNTNAATVGDPVYLDSAVPGGFVLTNPPGTGSYYQVVGRVVVKSATVGVVDLNLATGVPVAPDAARFAQSLPTIPTAAGTTEQMMVPTRGGTLLAAWASFPVALAVHAANFVQFAIINKQLGAGAVALLAAPAIGINSTVSGTGSTPIVAYTPFALTLAAGGPFVLGNRDELDVQVIGNGTLANTLPGGAVNFLVAPV